MAKTVSLRSTKEAALYFERVLPFDSLSAATGKNFDQDLYNECLPYEDGPVAVARAIKSLMPDVESPSELAYELLGLQLLIM